MSAIASTNFGVDVNSFENPNDQFIVYANKLVGKDPEPDKDKMKKMFKGIAFAIVLSEFCCSQSRRDQKGFHLI